MINNVVLMGRLTYDPEIRTTPQDVSVLRFQLAVDRNYQVKGEERKADFIDCTAWRQTAEFISRYFHKGSLIAVTGEIQTENYTDRDGNKRKSVTVVVSNASFCGRENSNPESNSAFSAPQTQNSYANAGSDDFEEIIDEEDDLPF